MTDERLRQIIGDYLEASLEHGTRTDRVRVFKQIGEQRLWAFAKQILEEAQPADPGILTRIYGQLFKFRVECPRCGELIVSNMRGHWIPRVQRIQCPQPTCNTAWTVGLILWPHRTGARVGKPPRDIVPGLRMVQRIRAVVASQRRGGQEAVNVVRSEKAAEVDYLEGRGPDPTSGGGT